MGRLYISLVASCLDASSSWQGPYVLFLLFLHYCWLGSHRTWIRCPWCDVGGNTATLCVQRPAILGFANRWALQQSEEAQSVLGKCDLPSLPGPALLPSSFPTLIFFLHVAGEEEGGWARAMLVKQPSLGGPGRAGRAVPCLLAGAGWGRW